MNGSEELVTDKSRDSDAKLLRSQEGGRRPAPVACTCKPRADEFVHKYLEALSRGGCSAVAEQRIHDHEDDQRPDESAAQFPGDQTCNAAASGTFHENASFQWSARDSRC